MSIHEKWMNRALEQAKLAVSHGEIPIGCVLVADGVEVAAGETGVSRYGPAVHGENSMLQQVGSQIWSLGHPLVLYTNVEPCLMCYGASLEAGVDHIVFGMSATFDAGTWAADGVRDRGRSVPQLTGDILSQETLDLMKAYMRENPDSPGAAYVKTLLHSEA